MAIRNLKIEFASKLSIPASEIELQGTEMWTGKGLWRKVSRTDRVEWYRRCVGLLAEFDLQLVYGVCDKQKLSDRYAHPMHPHYHYIALFLCLERIARYAKSKDQLAILVADDCSQDLRQLSKKTLAQYRESGAPFGPTEDISSIIDTFNFVDSKESEHLQLCDLSPFAVRRFRVLRDDMDGIYSIVAARTYAQATMPY